MRRIIDIEIESHAFRVESSNASIVPTWQEHRYIRLRLLRATAKICTAHYEAGPASYMDCGAFLHHIPDCHRSTQMRF